MLDGSQFSWKTWKQTNNERNPVLDQLNKGMSLLAKLMIFFQEWVLTKHMNKTTKLSKNGLRHERVNYRLQNGTASLYDNITKNNL